MENIKKHSRSPVALAERVPNYLPTSGEGSLEHSNGSLPMPSTQPRNTEDQQK